MLRTSRVSLFLLIVQLSLAPAGAQWNGAENLGQPPNDGTPQYSAVLSPDGTLVIINCIGTQCAGTNAQGENMIEFSLSGGSWGGRTELTLTNSDQDDYAWGWTQDGTLWLTSTRPSPYGTVNFYQAVKSSGVWQPATLMPQPVNSAVSSADDNYWGSVLPDGKTLYMVAYRLTGGIGRSVFVTRKVGNNWTPLVEASPTYFRDATWFAISPDEQTAYIDGQQIQGSTDIFQSTKLLGVWQQPVLVDIPVSSIDPDEYASVTSLGGGILFRSDRLGGSGSLDIWRADRVLDQIHLAMPNGYVNTTYGEVIPFWGGEQPYTIVRTGALPPGLALDASTGYVSGIPTAAGIYDFAIDIQDSRSDLASGTVRLRIYDTIRSTNDLVVGKGAQAGADTQVRLFKGDGTITSVSFVAFAGLAYGTNVAGGNIDTDAFAEILAAPGPGPANPPRARGFKRDGTAIPGVDFYPYAATGYGTNVNTGKMDTDGFYEILTAPGPGAVYGPQIRGFNWDGSAFSPIQKVNFYAYGTLKYGANVAAGDIDTDSGYDEIVTGAGPGAVFSPHLRAFNFDQQQIASINKINTFAFTGNYGINVAAAEVDGDPWDEILVGKGPDPSFSDDIKGYNYDFVTLSTHINYTNAYGNANVQGVRLWGIDLDGDGVEEIVTSPQADPPSGKQVKGWNWDGGPFSALGSTSFDPTPSYGAKVAGGYYGY